MTSIACRFERDTTQGEILSPENQKDWASKYYSLADELAVRLGPTIDAESQITHKELDLLLPHLLPSELHDTVVLDEINSGLLSSSGYKRAYRGHIMSALLPLVDVAILAAGKATRREVFWIGDDWPAYYREFAPVALSENSRYFAPHARVLEGALKHHPNVLGQVAVAVTESTFLQEEKTFPNMFGWATLQVKGF